MKKKQKWSFVDLDDKDFEEINKIDYTIENSKDKNITLEDLKKEKNIDKKNSWLNETNLSKEDFEPIKKFEKKIEYNVDYQDVLEEKESLEKSEIIKKFFVQNENQNNLKPRNTTRTFNQAVKNIEHSENKSFGDEKIKQFLTVKEKLDVKTNIYLKSSIVIKLKELEERTNESRSSIINKLIEIALKNIEEK